MSRRDSGTVKLARDGVEYAGRWSISKGLITVSLGFEKETTQVGGSAEVPEGLARMILGELIDRQIAKKQR
jgi:hypothetical protein